MTWSDIYRASPDNGSMAYPYSWALQALTSPVLIDVEWDEKIGGG